MTTNQTNPPETETESVSASWSLRPAQTGTGPGMVVSAEPAGLPAVSVFIEGKTSQIKQLLRRTASDIQLIGEALMAVKDVLMHGKFSQWLLAEFEWSERQAQRFMQVARAFAGVSLAGLPIMPSALYLLAAPGVREAVRAEALRRASLGDEISFAVAKELVASQLYFNKSGGVVVAGDLPEALLELQPPQFGCVVAGEMAGGDFPFVFAPDLPSSEAETETDEKVALAGATLTSQRAGNAVAPPTNFGFVELNREQSITGNVPLGLEIAENENENENKEGSPKVGTLAGGVVSGTAPAFAQTDLDLDWTGIRLSAEEKAATGALKLSEVARLGITKLEATCREQVVRLLLAHPEITGKKLRRLLSQLRQGEEFCEARDEALGWVNGKPVYVSSNPEIAGSSSSSNQFLPRSIEEQLSIISQNLLTSASCTKATLAQLEALLSTATAPATEIAGEPVLTVVQLDWVASLAKLAESNLVEQLKVGLVTRLLGNPGTPTALAANLAKYSDPVLQAQVLRFLQTF